MIAAAFALLSCLGAWVTWRRNPLYSFKATLRFLAVTLLLLAAAAGVMTCAVKFTEGRSVAVQVAVMGGGIILCTIALILGISKVSTPADPQAEPRLPPHVALVRLYRPRIRPYLKVAAISLGVSLLFLLVPGPVRWLAAIVAATIAFMASIMLPVAYYTALRLDRSVTALQLHPWVHWHYPAEAWRSWLDGLAETQARAQAVTMSAPARRWTIACLVVFAVGFPLFVVPAGIGWRIAWGLISGLVVLGLTLLSTSGVKRAQKTNAKRLRAAPPETFFGHDGVLCNGEFCSWLSADVYLLSAAVAAGSPRCIELWFEKMAPAAYGAPAASRVRQLVLMPADAAATDLPVLQAALVARCPTAEIHLA